MFHLPSGIELGVIVFVVVLIFGPKQIPKLGRALGDTIRSLREAGRELTGGGARDEDREDD